MPKASSAKADAPVAQRFYAVKVGRNPGIYETWAEVEEQIDDFPGAHYKSFLTKQDAESWRGLGDSKILRQHSINTVLSSPTATTDLAPGRSKPNRPSPYSRKAKAVSPSPQSIQFSTARAFYNRLKAGPTIKEGSESDEESTTLAIKVTDKVDTDVKAEDNTPAESSTTPKDPTLSAQQKRVLDRVMEGHSFFFTGSAGVGKSVLLRAIIREFDRRAEAASKEAQRLRSDKQVEDNDRFAPRVRQRTVIRGKLGKTASTGIAAINIGGRTLHAWSGIGWGKESKEVLCARVQSKDDALEDWQTSEALIIDEISMIDGKLLDKLDYIGRTVRGKSTPFGGLQLILCGDFFQLPPVSKHPDPPAKFAFEAECWNKIVPLKNMALLTRVFRQKDDAFIQLLENVRKGLCSTKQVKMLKQLSRPVVYEDGLEPVGLYPKRDQADAKNAHELSKLDTEEHRFQAVDQGGYDSNGQPVGTAAAKKLLDEETLWPNDVALKVGAFVMLVTNVGVEAALVNGSTGRVINFKTMDQARAEGIWVFSRGSKSSKLDTQDSSTTLFPVVRFDDSKHANGIKRDKVMIGPSVVEVLNSNGGVEASRVQLPLILAWALTIHKSQGQTIQRLRVECLRMFTYGQAYVALSRAVSLDCLQVDNFSKKAIMVSPTVLGWADSFELKSKTNTKRRAPRWSTKKN